MAPNVAKPWTSVKGKVILDEWRDSTNPTDIPQKNVVNSFSTKVVNGASVQFYKNRPTHAMSDREWFQEAIPNTMLEGIEDPTSAQIAFTRKITYEETGNRNDILDQDNFTALVVKKAINGEKVLHLEWIPLAVEKAWNEMYPKEKLDDRIGTYAYLVVCAAIVSHFGTKKDN